MTHMRALLAGRWSRHVLIVTAAASLYCASNASAEIPVDEGRAWKELLEFLSAFEPGSEATGFRICFLGYEPLTLGMALRLLELPESVAVQLPSPLSVALLRLPASAADEAREEGASHGERMLVYSETPSGPPGGSGCSAVILAAFSARPHIDLAEIITLISPGASAGAPLPRRRHGGEHILSDVFLLGHFGATCGPGDHGCRSLHSNWRDASGTAASCGQHFCGAAVAPHALMNVQLPQVDCLGMTTGDASPSEASQWQQDWFVYKNFIRGTSLDVQGQDAGRGDRQGVFVDVGAFHPIHLSNTYFFERCLGWRGLCVEPNPSMHSYFEAYRPACDLIKHCVWSKPRKVVMSFQKDPIEAYIREDEGGPLASENISGAVKISGEGKRPEFTAECKTLESILRGQNLQKPATVDFLSVDAEAAEVEIFKDFPFHDFDIQVINVEVQAHNYYELDAVILNAGYAKIAVLGGDHVYAKLNSQLVFPARMAEWRKALAENFWAHEAPRTATALNGRAGGPNSVPSE
eukprot:TRINITY_DN41333_c0_g1_i1.p1 TRINITY_DN41333_c0_g1~~TRINITY_DN41333_c0_g1_i1.p1  ORF type:complete len:523 (-),score=87.74 TRINITY_DN41333_c0_g1_i1:14-1582(-)